MSAGWQALSAAIEQAQALIAQAAPDPHVAAEGEAYISRLVAAGLSGAVLGHLLREDGLSIALPCQGGPNPDYLMRHAAIDPAQSYRLTGRIEESERVGIGLYGFGPNGTLLERGYAAFDRTNCPGDGSFALDIAADAVGPGKLAILPDAKILLIRVLHRAEAHSAAQLSLAGAAPAPGLSLITGSNDGALAFVASSLGSSVREYLKWTEAACDLTNRLDQAPPHLAETVKGDPDTQYFLGGFDLRQGEWLEVTMPAGLSGYWSLHGYNFWFEHLQTPGVHDRNARPDPDGRIRIAIGPELPDDALNRIDTLGRSRGALICRIIGGARSAAPEAALHRVGRG